MSKLIYMKELLNTFSQEKIEELIKLGELKKTDKETALAWWTSGRMRLCQYNAGQKYYPGKATLTEEDVVSIWMQENSSELKILRLNQLFAERKRIEEEIFKIDETALITYELNQL